MNLQTFKKYCELEGRKDAYRKESTEIEKAQKHENQNTGKLFQENLDRLQLGSKETI